MKEERGKWEDEIRSKIYDFEVETNSEDWNLIAAQLPHGKTVRMNPYRRYGYVAAAAVAALLLLGGLYLYLYDDKPTDVLTVVDNDNQQQEATNLEVFDNEMNLVEKSVENAVDNLVISLPSSAVTSTQNSSKQDSPKQDSKARTVPLDTDTPKEPATQWRPLPVEKLASGQTRELKTNEIPKRVTETAIHRGISVSDKPLIAAVEKKHRRWGFGVGGGGYAVSSTSGGPIISTSSKQLKPEDDYMINRKIISLRSTTQNALLAEPIVDVKTRLSDIRSGSIKHLTPISGGLGVSYALTDRWSLQSGAVYTLLRSKGSYFDNVANPVDWKQNLHFIGVPLSVSYSIAEWRRVRFYVSAGGMGEWNVAGKFKFQIVSAENLESVIHENARMKETLWSANTRAGAVYPLWKIINLYAEAGASYYFDNHSEIETIRSSKPFNVSLQAGIRLGF